MAAVAQRRKSDDGFALMIVMGVIAIVTVVALSGFVLAQQTLNESVVNGEQSRAFQAASTGLEQELPFFDPDHLNRWQGGKKVTLDTGDSYTVWVDDLGGGIYEMRSNGVSQGSGDTVLTRFQYLNLWDMNISGGGSTVGVKNSFNGSSWIYGSLYVNGNVDWGANGRLYGGPVFLKDGTWTASGNGQVGASGATVDAYGPVPSGGKYYTTQKGSAPDLELPTLSDANVASYLKMAQQTATRLPKGTASAHPNADAAYYTVWNGDSTIGTSSFGDWVDGDGTPATAVAFDSATGTLYLKDDAVIYCTGQVSFTSAVRQYSGRGIIVAKGSTVSGRLRGFNIDGSIRPANGLTEVIGVPGDQKTVPVMDGGNCLGLLSQGDIEVTAKSDWLVAAIFINGAIHATNSSHLDFRGSVICDSINFESTNVILATQPGLYKSLPKGMPELSGFVARSDWVHR